MDHTEAAVDYTGAIHTEISVSIIFLPRKQISNFKRKTIIQILNELRKKQHIQTDRILYFRVKTIIRKENLMSVIKYLLLKELKAYS